MEGSGGDDNTNGIVAIQTDLGSSMSNGIDITAEETVVRSSVVRSSNV